MTAKQGQRRRVGARGIRIHGCRDPAEDRFGRTLRQIVEQEDVGMRVRDMAEGPAQAGRADCHGCHVVQAMLFGQRAGGQVRRLEHGKEGEGAIQAFAQSLPER